MFTLNAAAIVSILLLVPLSTSVPLPRPQDTTTTFVPSSSAVTLLPLGTPSPAVGFGDLIIPSAGGTFNQFNKPSQGSGHGLTVVDLNSNDENDVVKSQTSHLEHISQRSDDGHERKLNEFNLMPFGQENRDPRFGGHHRSLASVILT